MPHCNPWRIPASAGSLAPGMESCGHLASSRPFHFTGSPCPSPCGAGTSWPLLWSGCGSWTRSLHPRAVINCFQDVGSPGVWGTERGGAGPPERVLSCPRSHNFRCLRATKPEFSECWRLGRGWWEAGFRVGETVKMERKWGIWLDLSPWICYAPQSCSPLFSSADDVVTVPAACSADRWCQW